MTLLKQATRRVKTTNVVLHSDTTEELEDSIALMLLIGGYNPLRKYSDADPINLEELKMLQDRFADLLFDVKKGMNVNVFDVEKL